MIPTAMKLWDGVEVDLAGGGGIDVMAKVCALQVDTCSALIVTLKLSRFLDRGSQD